MRIKGSLTRSVVIGAVAALTALAGLAFAPGAGAAANYTQTRFAGTDRFDTAALISAAIAEATPTAVIARADIYPDALTGAFAAAANGDGPLMLTRSDSVPQRTIDSLRAEGVTSVILLGGTAAISDAAEAQLRSSGFTTRRIGGANRYETAANIARDGSAIIGTIDGKRTAILSSGENFPDALSGAPLSFAVGLPSLLTGPTSLHPAALSALQSLNIAQVLILGGPAAVAQSVEDDLRTRGFSPVRLAGANRSGTSVEVFKFGIDKTVYTNRRFGLARGDTFPDALAYAPLAGRPRATVAPDGNAADKVSPTFNANGLLLAAANCTLSAEVENFIAQNSSTWTRGEILGGDQAICPAVADQVLNAAKFGDSKVTLSSTGGASGSTVTASYTGTRPANITNISSPNCTIGSQGTQNNNRTFTVSGAPGTACTINTTIQFTDAQGGTQTQTGTFTIAGGGPTPPPASTGGVSAGPQLATNTPDLTAVTIINGVPNDGIANQVRYTFDANIQTLGANTLFSVQGFDSATRLNAVTVATESGGTTVLANFADGTDLRLFTIGTTDSGAATNSSGPSVLASKALGGSSIGTASGITNAPVLLSTEGANDASRQITYVFDKSVRNPSATNFGFYDANANRVTGTSAVVQDGDNKRVIVTFANGVIVSQAVRYFANDASSNNTNNDGNANNDSAVESAVTGAFPDNALGHTGAGTSAPDLISVARVANVPNQIDFTFDRNVAATGIATDFAIYNVDGTRQDGTNVTATSNPATLRVTFPVISQQNADQFTRAGVENGATTASATPAQANTVGGFALPAFGDGPGFTDGPDLILATFTEASNQVRYTFDEDISGTPLATSFFVVNAGGGATFGLVGTQVVSGRDVTINFAPGTLASAVGAGVTSTTGTQSGVATNAAVDIDANQNSPDSVGRS